MITCVKCQKEKAESEYYTQIQKSGKRFVRLECKDCTRQDQKNFRLLNKEKHNADSRARNQKNKQTIVDKFGNKCLDCGGVFPPCVYDFHHLDPSTKEKQISPWLSKTNDHYSKELEKCVMLCANCHRIRHHGMQREPEQIWRFPDKT